MMELQRFTTGDRSVAGLIVHTGELSTRPRKMQVKINDEPRVKHVEL